MDFLIALALNLIFIALVALLLWPLGKAMLSLRLAKGYVVFWIITFITAVALYRIQRWFRVDADTHVDHYVLSNLGHSVLLLSGWSAFAALLTHSFVVETSTWRAVVLWMVAFGSCVVAFIIVTTFHRGSVYRLVNLFVALVSLVVFAVWPAAAHALFGWFFDLF